MEERNNVIRMANEHAAKYAAAQMDPANPESTVAGKSIGELKLMADILEDIQSNLEPIRDRALDERARLMGYSQCAEAMIKIIADRAASYKRQAIDAARQQHEARQQETLQQQGEAPQQQQEAAPKKPNGLKTRRNRGSKKQEGQSLGDNSVAQQRGSA